MFYYLGDSMVISDLSIALEVYAKVQHVSDQGSFMIIGRVLENGVGGRGCMRFNFDSPFKRRKTKTMFNVIPIAVLLLIVAELIEACPKHDIYEDYRTWTGENVTRESVQDECRVICRKDTDLAECIKRCQKNTEKPTTMLCLRIMLTCVFIAGLAGPIKACNYDIYQEYRLWFGGNITREVVQDDCKNTVCRSDKETEECTTKCQQEFEDILYDAMHIIF
ncbi:hypothetical protein CAPTEDRAFT_185964 [Capitella teleta]|uniref:Uncharacterized protein n=1 Tax=Capitella teleta TaxID=283909 RepID=R7VFZ3_CAPTE|nr:hypothetical protein CAPTEDRAFT_185964 [Capitella teleta]|eukprot:ELU17758.1 hypothetical protein CAPTEDRAFT_185964 [Capitella teleta]